MAAEGIAVRKILEILRLRFELGQSERVTARSVNCARSTVGNYVALARQLGLDRWEKVSALTEGELEKLLFKNASNAFETSSSDRQSKRPLPDWNKIHLELKRVGVTVELLWQEYREQFPNDALGRTQFCEHYSRYKKKLSLVMRQDHKAGEKSFVDYSGNGIEIVDPRTGEISVAQIFVGVLGASSYTFACATPRQDLPSWLDAHVKMYEFFGGVTEVTVPDNCKTAVTKVCRYDPELNRSYQDLADHYGTCVVPARPYRPRDKGKVETAVLVAQRWIVAVLRNRLFHSIPELNLAILVCLEKINSKTMRHLKKSRRELFEELDRPALKKLPLKAYELALWQKTRLNIDYHIEVDEHYYSAPYGLVQMELWARLTVSVVEIFHKGNRVASHLRSYIKYKATTLTEHMPPSHRAHAQWTPSRIVTWADKFGPACAQVVQKILESKSHPELGYRSALGLIRFEKKYSAGRLERACKKALAMQSPHYQTVKTILKNFAEDIPLPGQHLAPTTPGLPQTSQKNLRGNLYFN